MREASQKGYLFEHEVAEKLKGRGFSHIKVTKASRDYGADILAFKNGLEYVFQCKKYKGTVGFQAVKDVATAMDIYQADKGVLVCDTRFSRAAYIAVDKIEKPIELIDLEKIRNWKLVKAESSHYTPHYYQRKILSDLTKHRKQGNRSALLVLATGLGKTLVAAWDLKNQIKKGQKALFLVHRKDILIDNAEKFHAVINPKEERFKFGIYFEGKKFDKNVDIVFSTFQTLRKHHKDISPKYFDYIIIDEAHHSPAQTYAELIAYFQPRFLLGITATPKRIAKQDNEFIESAFGKPLVDLDLAEALIKKYVSPVKYSVFCDNIDYEKLQSVKKKLSIDQLNRSYFIPTKDEDIEKIIFAEKGKLGNPKTIIFCPSIRYINSVKSVGLFSDAEVYHSNMSDFDRQIIFRRFKLGKIRTLLVVSMFDEGIDIPDANLVVFLRTTYSPTIFFQQLGRGLRKAKGKKFLRVLDFVGAMSKLKKAINVFGHLLIIQDFVEKVEKQKQFSNIHRGRVYKGSELLDSLDLNFYQAGRKVAHKETLFRQKPFLDELRFLKKKLIKSEGWTEEEIIGELKLVCEKLGHFPSRGHLIAIGRVDLTVQIARYGGVYYLAKKMGYEVISQKPKGYWNKWENIKKELLPLCDKLGKIPTRGYFERIGKADLHAAIYSKWGGPNKVAEKLGYEANKKSNGYWDDWEHLKKELLPICLKLGRFPTQKELTKLNRYDLSNAIYRFGYYSDVANKLGYKTNKKIKGYWKEWAHLKKELIPICKSLGRFPKKTDLIKLNKRYLNNPIISFGGFHVLAKKMKYKIFKKQPNYWKKWENIERELSPICSKLDRMPTSGYLRHINRGDLWHAIIKHGGVYKVAKKMGYKVDNKTKKQWTRESLIGELLSVCKKIGRFPTTSELKKYQMPCLPTIVRYLGPAQLISRIVGFPTKHKPKGYWSKFLNIKKEILPICKKLNKFPTATELKHLKQSSLLSAITKFGAHNVAKRLGYKIVERPKKYWKEWRNVRRGLLPICKKLGHMPNNPYLMNIKRSDLVASINATWGGIYRVGEKMGYKVWSNKQMQDTRKH